MSTLCSVTRWIVEELDRRRIKIVIFVARKASALGHHRRDHVKNELSINNSFELMDYGNFFYKICIAGLVVESRNISKNHEVAISLILQPIEQWFNQSQYPHQHQAEALPVPGSVAADKISARSCATTSLIIATCSPVSSVAATISPYFRAAIRPRSIGANDTR